MRKTARIAAVAAFGAALVAVGSVSAGAVSPPGGWPVAASSTPPAMTPPTPPATPPTMDPPTPPPMTPPTPPPTPAPEPCPPAQNPRPPTDDEIRALYTAWRDAVGDHDAEKVSRLYAPDAVLQPTFSPQVRVGRAAIKDYFTHLFETSPQVQASLADRRGLKIFGATGASDYGLYNFIPVPGRAAIEARYTFVYQRCAEGWLIVNHHSSVIPAA